MEEKTAADRWNTLEGDRRPFLFRCEKYSALTVPRICPHDSYNQFTTELQHDWQSVGAQAVNHLTNKLMLALFAPSRPFFRIEASSKAVAQFAESGIDEGKLREITASVERAAVKAMDKKSLRPKLHEAVMHLIVTGNVMLCLDKSHTRVVGLKKYVVKRDVYGHVIEQIIKDTITVAQLDESIQELPMIARLEKSATVSMYKWFKKVGNDYHMTTWIDGQQLPKSYNGKWPADKMPYRALTWVLVDGSDYGSGHVEDYVGEFESLSTLSRAETQGAVLASEYRWLVNPAGITSPEDMEDSENGAAIPGQAGDINLVSTGTTSALPHIKDIISSRENRIGRGFLLGSAVTRNAERVTAEEIRMQANELETSLGGAYSRIALDLQIPMAYYLLNEVDAKIDGKELEPVIVTGLDALSRNGDLDNMKMFLGDLSSIQSLHPSALEQLNLQSIITILAAGHGVSKKDVMLEDEQIQQNIAARQAAQAVGAEGVQPGTSQPTVAPAPPPQ